MVFFYILYKFKSSFSVLVPASVYVSDCLILFKAF